MNFIKLDYFTLLSPEPLQIPGVGSIVSPTLRDIQRINYNMYQSYLDVFLTDISLYYEFIDKSGEAYLSHMSNIEKNIVLDVKREYENLSDAEKHSISFFNIAIIDPIYRSRLLSAFDFFIRENVVWSEENKVIFIFKDDNYEKTKPIGVIHGENYEAIADIILQKSGVNKPDEYGDGLKTKNKAALKILDKLKNASKKNKVKQQGDKRLALPNIISSLAAHSKSLNIINIWDVTVYQLYDQFARQQFDDAYNINASQVAAWGDKNNKFDALSWATLKDD